MYAPVTLFVYNRPAHTRRTVEALRKNELASESDLIIYSDAPKKPEAAEAVREVREYIRTISGFRSVSIVERDKNWGLANSIIDGVTTVVNRYGRIIVLEDDLVTSPYFLQFMNEALDRYQDDPRVMQISGHMFPADVTAETDAVFLPMTTSWGWATWQRAWQYFDPTAAGYETIKRDAKLRRHFNLDGSYGYFGMLEQQLQGKIDSWAVRWHLSVFLHGGLTLFPQKTLVENTGFDGSGTHCEANYLASSLPHELKVKKFPEVVIDEEAKQAVYAYLATQGGRVQGLRRRITKWLGWKH
jgi:hypothetical protein